MDTYMHAYNMHKCIHTCVQNQTHIVHPHTHICERVHVFTHHLPYVHLRMLIFGAKRHKTKGEKVQNKIPLLFKLKNSAIKAARVCRVAGNGCVGEQECVGWQEECVGELEKWVGWQVIDRVRF